MIDYTQYAFQAPPQVVDPIPTVADYLDDYTARNEAWYQTFAAPLQGGGYGARPSSFERRAPYIPIPETPENPVPPILRDMPQYEGSEDNRTRPDDRPVGSLVRDVGDMSVPDLFAEYEAGTSGAAPYAASAPAMLLSAAVPGLSAVGGAMARDAVAARNLELLGALAAQDASMALLPDVGMIGRVGTPTISEAPGRDVIDQLVLGGSDLPDQGLFARVGTPTVTPSQSDSDRGYGGGRDSYQGGEVGAGGWAGGGGL